MTHSSIDFGLPSDTGGKDLGIFTPMANGGWILSNNAPTLDGSYAYNREVARLAESFGYDFVMSMAKWRGYGGPRRHWQSTLDASLLMAAVAEATSRVKVWTTIHTLLQNPAVAAKMIATLDHISGGRAGLNIVTGSYKDEFGQMGAWREGVDHDQRYDLATEWIQCIKRLWSEPSVTHEGTYFQLRDCQSDPKPLSLPRPFLVCAGLSERGMRFTAEEADAIFLTGKDNAGMKENSLKMKEMASRHGRRLRTYTYITLVLGESDEKAQAAACHYRAGFDEEAFRGMMRAYGFLDAELGKENDFVAASRSAFMTPYLIGSPKSVSEQLTSLLEEAQLDGAMLIFPDYLAGMTLFAEGAMPQVRAHFAAPADGAGRAGRARSLSRGWNP